MSAIELCKSILKKARQLPVLKGSCEACKEKFNRAHELKDEKLLLESFECSKYCRDYYELEYQVKACRELIELRGL